MLLFFIPLSLLLHLYFFTIFPLNLSNHISFAIIKSFNLLRLLFAFLLISSIICFSLRAAFFQFFPWYLSFPALATSYLPDSSIFFRFLFLCEWPLNFKFDFHCSRYCIYCISFFWQGVLTS